MSRKRKADVDLLIGQLKELKEHDIPYDLPSDVYNDINFKCKALKTGWDILIANEKYKQHITVRLFNPITKKYIDIDKEIKELIQEIWKADIKTLSSCQNDDPDQYIRITFASGTDFDKFIVAVTKDMKQTDQIYSRIVRNATEYSWNISVDIFCNERGILDKTKNINRYVSCVSVKFHKIDYDTLVGNIKKYNQEKSKDV